MTLYARPATAEQAAKCCERTIQAAQDRKNPLYRGLNLYGEAMLEYIQAEYRRKKTIEAVRDRGLSE